MTNVRVYFATNRNHQPENTKLVFGPRFNADGVAALRYGHVDFSPGVETLQGAEVTVYEDAAGPEFDPTKGGARLLEELRKGMCIDQLDTLVFIHGFNVTFNGAIEAGLRLAREVRIRDPNGVSKPVNVVVFSWPSDGTAVPYMSYYSDREDARASGPALARAYLKLRDFLAQLPVAQRCQRRIHLLAHSMGNYLLRQGVQAILAKEPDGLVRLFDQILLAAPDEDDDTFELDSKLKSLPRIGRQVTVYFNPSDLALITSDKTKGNPDRLGSDGPRLVDLLPKKVVLVDCRNVARDADMLVGHSYYIRSPAMAVDIASVLEGMDPEKIGNRAYIQQLRAYRIAGDPA
ncbi:alpha/beta fold hydrolase [Caulobacter sp.]|uniref:alpha/beta hydrolase n=1 Tax=Caulobacter sp. TaxID=78 RepID=UPI001B235908|nr:alpha/beta fold hydrolase [Caulobacter sp.]MBO9544700.1 alpha/beta fold hydrolase [Caulobacter sp.]